LALRVWVDSLCLTAIIAVGLVARLVDVGRESLWLDEAGRVAIATLPLPELLHGVAVIELSPPLYHLLLHGWVRLVGEGDVAVRVLSALMIVPTAVAAWWLGRTLGGRPVAAALALLASVSPFAVHYGQEAAMYALLLALSSAALACLARYLSASALSGWRLPLAYLLLAVLALYTHYYAVLFFLAAGVVWLVRALGAARQRDRWADLAHFASPMTGERGENPRATPSGQVGEPEGVGAAGSTEVRAASRGGRRALARPGRWSGCGGAMLLQWAVVHGLMFGAVLPWGAVAAAQSDVATSIDGWRGSSLSDALGQWSTIVFLDVAGAWPGIASATLLVAAAALGAWRLRGRTVAWLLPALCLVLPIAAAALLGPLYRERGFITVAPALWGLVAVGVAGPGGRGRVDVCLRLALGVSVAAATLAGLAAHQVERKEQWREAAALVAERAQPGAPIFFIHYGTQVAFDRYFAGPQPRVGLPHAFTWAQGFRAPYRVTPNAVARRVPSALSGVGQAWVVLSHDEGRGTDLLLAELDRWGTVVVDERGLYAIRVLAYDVR
jgi:hypothetical protein